MLKIIISVLMLMASIQSAEIDRGVALKVAKSIYLQNKPDSHIAEFKVKKLDIIYASDNSAVMYIFNLSPLGFVIVSAEARTFPALGYSYESSFKLADMPLSLQTIFDGYKTDIKDIRNINPSQLDEVKIQWDLHRSVTPIYESSRNVSPLIDAEFDQSGGWNNGVTSEIGFNGPVGCVAVAMAQAMHYWSHPYVGEGSHLYMKMIMGKFL